MLEPCARDELLAHVGAHGIMLHRPNGDVLMLDARGRRADITIDLTHPSMWAPSAASVPWTLCAHDNRILRVLGPSPRGPGDTVEVLLDEAPLRREMWDFGIRILELSIVISLITAALVYLSLQWLLVPPMRRITASMIAFRDDPEDASRMIAPSGRGDEIGVAQRELAVMQETVRQALAPARPPRRARHRRHQDQPRSAQHPVDRAARHRRAGRKCGAGSAPDRRGCSTRSTAPWRSARAPSISRARALRRSRRVRFARRR